MKPQGDSNLCWRNCFFICIFCWIYSVLGKHICSLRTENKDTLIVNSNLFLFSHSFVTLILTVHYIRSKVLIVVNFNTKTKSIYACMFISFIDSTFQLLTDSSMLYASNYQTMLSHQSFLGNAKISPGFTKEFPVKLTLFQGLQVLECMHKFHTGFMAYSYKYLKILGIGINK